MPFHFRELTEFTKKLEFLRRAAWSRHITSRQRSHRFATASQRCGPIEVLAGNREGRTALLQLIGVARIGMGGLWVKKGVSRIKDYQICYIKFILHLLVYWPAYSADWAVVDQPIPVPPVYESQWTYPAAGPLANNQCHGALLVDALIRDRTRGPPTWPMSERWAGRHW